MFRWNCMYNISPQFPFEQNVYLSVRTLVVSDIALIDTVTWHPSNANVTVLLIICRIKPFLCTFPIFLHTSNGLQLFCLCFTVGHHAFDCSDISPQIAWDYFRLLLWMSSQYSKYRRNQTPLCGIVNMSISMALMVLYYIILDIYSQFNHSVLSSDAHNIFVDCCVGEYFHLQIFMN
jgi:hypothetical protein